MRSDFSNEINYFWQVSPDYKNVAFVLELALPITIYNYDDNSSR